MFKHFLSKVFQHKLFLISYLPLALEKLKKFCNQSQLPENALIPGLSSLPTSYPIILIAMLIDAGTTLEKKT